MPTKTDTPTPTRTTPAPTREPVRRYSPDPDHCPQQWVRTVRRVGDV